MYAVIQTGGKQYRVEPGQDIQIEKLPGTVGDAVTFDQVLAVKSGDDLKVGRPTLAGARVVAKVVEQGKSPKIRIFKKKRTKQYRRTAGHRQAFTAVVVEEIVGEIRDEYDREERGPVERLPDGSMVVSGSALLKDLKTDFALPFDESPDYHTLAGLLLARLKRIPRGGEWIDENGYKLTIVDMEGRRIVKIKVEGNKPA